MQYIQITDVNIDEEDVFGLKESALLPANVFED
jgi:hypothetical protein